MNAPLAPVISVSRLRGSPQVEQRLSRWLLITANGTHTDTFKLSQEFLSHMLGSTRSPISVVASTLKKEGLISYTRGVITILDRKGLEERSCVC